MRNIALLLQYKGTAYHGWQRQENALTVQEVVERALAKTLGEPCSVHGCGRTDAGVHAERYVCNFLSDTKIPDDRLAGALNHYLPSDIGVIGAQTTKQDFHAQYHIVRKRYRYIILNRHYGDVFLCDRVWHYRHTLDIDAMQSACLSFIGTHDFSAFCASGGSAREHTRTVYSLTCEKAGDLITIDICGNGFLYNMVRIIAGTLVYVGNGKIALQQVPGIIASGNRRLAGITAPAQGLYMYRVYYDEKYGIAID